DGADNSPQIVTVLFSVRTVGSLLPPELRPTGLVFTGTAGGAPPADQLVNISVPGLTPLTYHSSDLTLHRQNLFTHSPKSGTAFPGQATPLSVHPNFSALQPGILNGVLTVQFSDNHVGTVNILGVVAPSTAGSNARDAGGCTPTRLRMQLLSGTN